MEKRNRPNLQFLKRGEQMKKIGLMFLMILMIFSTTVHANSIDSITMDIYIDKYGNAEITEVWECYINHGTESYIELYLHEIRMEH